MSCCQHRWGVAAALLLGTVATASVSVAQPSDMSSMYGRPLYMARMAAGQATVRVIGKGFADKRVGVAVTLYAVGKKSVDKIGETKTDDKSRAVFDKLEASRVYFIEAVVKDKTLRTHAFNGPRQGGVRFLLSTIVKSVPPRPQPGANAAAQAPAPSAAVEKKKAPSKPQKIKKGQSGAAAMRPLADADNGTLRVKVVLGRKAAAVAKARVSVIVDGVKQGRRTDDSGTTTVKIAETAKTVRVTVGHAGLSYRSQKIVPPKKGGVELTFTVYNRTTDSSVLAFGSGSHLLCGVGEKRLGFRQVLAIINTSDKLFNPGKGLELPVPQGADRVEVSKGDKRFVTKRGKRLFVTTPIPPGRLAVQYFFELPYAEGVADLSQTMPLATQRLVFIFTNNTSATLAGPSMLSRRVETMRGRKTVIYTLRAAKAGEKLELTIGGLPKDKSRLTTIVAISLASVILLWGVLGAAAHRRPDTERKREALLDELATLEAQRRRALRAAGKLAEPRRRRQSARAITGPLPRVEIEAAAKAKATAETDADAAADADADEGKGKGKGAKFDEKKYEKRRAEIIAELSGLWRDDKGAS